MKDASTENFPNKSLLLFSRAISWLIVASMATAAFLFTAFIVKKTTQFLLNTSLLIITALDIKDERPYKLLAWLGADINLLVDSPEKYTRSDLRTPFRYAYKYDKQNAMGALINAANTDSFTKAMAEAICRGNIGMLGLLVKTKAKASGRLPAHDSSNVTILALSEASTTAIHSIEAIRLLIDNSESTLPELFGDFASIPSKRNTRAMRIISKLMLENGLSIDENAISFSKKVYHSTSYPKASKEKLATPLIIALGFKACEAWKGLSRNEFEQVISDAKSNQVLDIITHISPAYVESFTDLNTAQKREAAQYAIEFGESLLPLAKNFFCTNINDARANIKELMKFLGTSQIICKGGFEKHIGSEHIYVLLISHAYQISFLAANTAYCLCTSTKSDQETINLAAEKCKINLTLNYSLLEARTLAVIDAFRSSPNTNDRSL